MKNNNTSVVRVPIDLGDIPLVVFREIISEDDYTDHLNQQEVLNAIDEPDFNIRDFFKSKWLKTLIGKEYTTERTRFKVKGEGTSIKPLPVEIAVAFWQYRSESGNLKARRLVLAATAESIGRRVDKKLNQQREEEEYNRKFKARMDGKIVRRCLTDAVSDWCTRNSPKQSYIDWIFVNVSNTLNRGLFGKSAKDLCEEKGCDREHLRDSFSESELREIGFIEDLAMRFIDKDDIEPIEAVKKALEFKQI